MKPTASPKNVFQYLLEGVSADIVKYLMDDGNISMSEAILTLHNSETFSKLCNPATELYIASSAYVYELLKSELKMGCII